MPADAFSPGAVFAHLHVHGMAEPLPAAVNMAVDEVLLETAALPTLRFYDWQKPSLSFGYFGRYSDIGEEAERRDIVRRWTGGGIVLHGTDLTYSLSLPAEYLHDSRSSRALYLRVHSAIQHALRASSEVELARSDAPKVSEACFANPVVADVLIAGRKIAGAAQRRTRAGLLHQGSIQFDRLPADFQEGFAAALCGAFTLQPIAAAVLHRAHNLAAEKYATAAWLKRR